jgi:hypothetical protein
MLCAMQCPALGIEINSLPFECTTYILFPATHHLYLFNVNRPYDRAIALEKMKDQGAILTTTESLLFELMETAEHPHFRAISSLIKTHNAEHINQFALLGSGMHC